TWWFIVEKRAIITPSGDMVDKNLILPTKGIVNKDETIKKSDRHFFFTNFIYYRELLYLSKRNSIGYHAR
ncbi:unnamed protein product, partial [marine sediment metagenome]